MTLYEKFRRMKVDLSPIGLGKGSGRSDYFCTPKGARIIGWEGTDGIHYCFLKDFGEMVFSVNPMEMPGGHVHPLARNFEDFLRLLLACGSAAALEQAHAWTKEQFEQYLRDDQPAQEQREALDAMGKRLCLSPMEEPFAYLQDLQKGFDYGKLRYQAAYSEWEPTEPKSRKKPEWKVFFDGNFQGHGGKGRAGKEVSIGKRFVWGEDVWHVPAVYLCGAGLVADLCREVDPERIRAFQEKWELKSWEELLSEGQKDDGTREQMDAENPMSSDFTARLWINGRLSPSMRGCSICWTPKSCLLEGQENEPEAEQVLEHYGLAKDRGWALWRMAFPWTVRRRPVIRSVELDLEQRPAAFAGAHFETPKVGESFSFCNPLTGAEHVLTVLAFEQRVLEHGVFGMEGYEFPRHYSMLSYALTPELADREFSVRDCAGADAPKRKEEAPFKPKAKAAAGVAVIGGADGPTAIFMAGKGDGARTHTACSSLHFEPADSVEWRMVFYQKLLEDVKVPLMEKADGRREAAADRKSRRKM